MYPTDGASTAISLSATIPGSDLNYYRINLRQKFYQPIGRGFVFGFNGEIRISYPLLAIQKKHLSFKISLQVVQDLLEVLNQIH